MNKRRRISKPSAQAGGGQLTPKRSLKDSVNFKNKVFLISALIVILVLGLLFFGEGITGAVIGTDFGLFASPSQGTPLLNSTYGQNTTDENLTVYPQSVICEGACKNITDWRLWNGSDNVSIAVLNMPFEADGSQNATDYSSFENNGTVTSATWNSTGGYDGMGAFELDGDGDRINLPASEDFNFSTNISEFTISVWTKANSKTGYLYIYGDILSSNGMGLRIDSPSGNPGLYVLTGTDVSVSCSSVDLTDGNWHYIAGVYNKSHLLIYCDGGSAIVSATPITEEMSTSCAPSIGSLRSELSNSDYNGTIDDVLIFNRSLSADQIQALYNNRTDLISSEETSADDEWIACTTPNNATGDGTTDCSTNLTILAATNPLVFELVPTNTSNYTTSQTIEIAANVTDDISVSSVTANVSIPNGTIKVLTLSNAEGAKYNNSFAIQNVTGTYNVTYIALDNYNNLNQSEITTFNVNHTGPTVNIISPENYTWTTSLTPTFQFNFTDDIASQAICEILVDGTVVATNSTTLNNTLTTLAASTLTLGTRDWTVNCTDDEGGYNISAVNYTLDVVEAPTLTAQDNDTWIPASGSTNYTANGTAFTFNFTSEMVAGADTSSASCELWFTNSSGNTINIGLNSTTLNGTETTIQNNITLTEGQSQNWYINCSYNSTDIVSETRVINVDTTTPNVYLEVGQSHDNWTWTTDTTPTLYYNFTDHTSPNASCEIFMNEVGRGTNATVLNDTQTIWTNTTALSAGTYQWYVNCTDYMSNLGTSLTTSDYFILEIISTNVNLVTPTNNSWTSETRAGNVSFVFNFTNGIADQASCELFITNASGTEIANGVNTTTLNNTATTITNNNSLLSTLNPNGVKANWTVNCTFNGTTITAADYFSLNVDNVTPTVTVSSSDVSTTTATLTTTTSEAATCKYSTSNIGYADMTGFGTTGGVTSHTTSLVSLSSGTGYTYYVKCQDSVPNTGSGSTSFTTTSTSGGSGPSGAGGGTSTGVTGQFEKKVWTSINKGETAKMKVKNGIIGVTEIEFKVKDTTYGAWINVEKVDSLPSTIKTIPRKVYSNIKITENNVKKVLEGKAVIKFKVAKSWLTENKIGNDNVALFRYKDDKWHELLTAVGEDDGVHVYYSAETEGFSYFIIGEETPETYVEPTEETAEVVELPEEKEEVVKEKKLVIHWEKINWLWLVPIVVGIVGIIIVYLLLRKKK